MEVRSQIEKSTFVKLSTIKAGDCYKYNPNSTDIYLVLGTDQLRVANLSENKIAVMELESCNIYSSSPDDDVIPVSGYFQITGTT